MIHLILLFRVSFSIYLFFQPKDVILCEKPNQLLIRSWVHPNMPQLDIFQPNTMSPRLFGVV